ncbi:MAG: helix-turn-helix transcriptional regulator, partial [Planctomycetes bacterium]|nr:helix-turn-helix transcriptional regulator [Planctomycetota bacterium]
VQRAGPLPPALQRALQYASANLTAAASLRGAARAAGVTPEHLTRLARTHLGRPFHAHLIAMRLVEARRLLADAELPIPAVAAACGFGSCEHFQRTFRRQVGMPPGAWRREVVAGTGK